MEQNSNIVAANRLLKTLELIEERICGRCRHPGCNTEGLVQCGDGRLVEQAKNELVQLIATFHEG